MASHSKSIKDLTIEELEDYRSRLVVFKKRLESLTEALDDLGEFPGDHQDKITSEREASANKKKSR
jgi:predicted  nucleic acid-binding Zn-ribbon protein